MGNDCIVFEPGVTVLKLSWEDKKAREEKWKLELAEIRKTKREKRLMKISAHVVQALPQADCDVATSFMDANKCEIYNEKVCLRIPVEIARCLTGTPLIVAYVYQVR